MKNTFKVDETNLIEEFDTQFEHQFQFLKKRFESRRIKCYSANAKEDVREFITNFILKREYIRDISFSDSVTLYQLGIYDFMRDSFGKSHSINEPLERSESGHYNIYGVQPRGRMNLPYDEWIDKHEKWYNNVRKSLCSDLLIIGANAITLEGEIVSVDGLGNRVSGMVFGPRHVICIVGKNKISTNLESAMDRVQNVAAPLNYIRHANKHYTKHEVLPCVKLGKCFKCSNPESACMNTVVVRGQIHHHSDRIHLVVVNKNLGF